MKKNWLGQLCKILGYEVDQLKLELLSYNNSVAVRGTSDGYISSKVIKNWTKDKSATPNRRTSLFLKSFLERFMEHIYGNAESSLSTVELMDFISQLDERIAIGNPKKREAFKDPFSLVLNKHLRTSLLPGDKLKNVLGYHSLIRYNSMENRLTADLLEIELLEGILKVTLINENGLHYTGQCVIIKNKAYFTLVNDKDISLQIGSSIRVLMFEIPLEYESLSIVGLMLRISGTSGAPISSIVILDKIVDKENIIEIMKISKNANGTYTPEHRKLLRERGLIDKPKFTGKNYEKYQAILMNKGSNYVSPLQPPSLDEVRKVFGRNR